MLEDTLLQHVVDDLGDPAAADSDQLRRHTTAVTVHEVITPAHDGTGTVAGEPGEGSRFARHLPR